MTGALCLSSAPDPYPQHAPTKLVDGPGIIEQKGSFVQYSEAPLRPEFIYLPGEVDRLLAQLTGTHALVISLLYDSGLRLMEALRLRVKDLDFDYQQITARPGKGEKDRRTILPRPLTELLRYQLALVNLLHDQDLREGCGAVYLPYALARKYPQAC